MAYSNPIPNIIDDSIPHNEQEPDYKQIDEVFLNLQVHMKTL